ncbi:hypothetical protein TrispH2_010902, partial [Trichoplax sp. H2]
MPTVDGETASLSTRDVANASVTYIGSVSDSDQCLHLKIYLLSLGANVKE